jgi:predicted metal-binding membrane protein
MASRSATPEVEPRGKAVRQDGAFFAVATLLFLATAVATAHWCGSMSSGMQMPGGWVMSMAWMRMPGQTWSAAAGVFLGMWTLMMVAMMLPSLVPSLSSYRRSIPGLARPRLAGLTIVAGAGYFAVWVALGACIYLLGIALAAAEMQWEALARIVPLASGAALVLGGWVQRSAWKAGQLGQCRSSLRPSTSTDATMAQITLVGRMDRAAMATEIKERRRELGPSQVTGGATPRSAARASEDRSTRVVFAISAWRVGLHLGVRCVLCCSGLMTLLLVLGVMDLRVMAIVAAVITLERLAPGAEQIARAAGVVIIGAGLLLVARAVAGT